VRVRLRPAGGYKEPAPGPLPEPGKDVAWTGRLRDDLQRLLATGRSHMDARPRTLDTSALSVSVSLNPSPDADWSDASGRRLLQDRGTSAYFTERTHRRVRHYLPATAPSVTTVWATRPAR
jgi:hypothetical protein